MTRTARGAGLGVGIVLALLATACEASGDLMCQASLVCRGAPVQTCCSRSHCEYRHEGRTYPCVGTDCSAASAQALASCPCQDATLDLDASVLDGAVDGAPLDGSSLDAPGCVR